MLLDQALDTEPVISSNTALKEVQAEIFSFDTAQANQEVTFAITIPFTVHQTIAGSQNGAYRLYLDGDAIVGNQWNGTLIMNGGAWCFQANLPTNGRCSGTVKLVIPTSGTHKIRLMYAGSSTVTIGTLRSRRRYQIW